MIRSKITWLACAAALTGMAATGCSREATAADPQTIAPDQKPTTGAAAPMMAPQAQEPGQQPSQQQGQQPGTATQDEPMGQQDQQAEPQSQQGQQTQQADTPDTQPQARNDLSQYQDQEPIGTRRGTATFYDEGFAGRPTASGETFDPTQMTAASRRYPLGSIIRVVNTANDQSVVVRINDRLSVDNEDGADLDLSRAAAEQIDMIDAGRVNVRIEVLELANR